MKLCILQFPTFNSLQCDVHALHVAKHCHLLKHILDHVSKSHMIHGAAIYGNMDPIKIPPLC